jgi:hypothetical protein
VLDERSISSMEQYLCNLDSFDREEAEVRMDKTRVRCEILCGGLDDDSDESDDSVAHA